MDEIPLISDIEHEPEFDNQMDDKIDETYYYLWEKDSLAVLLSNIYNYYYYKGFWPIILRHIFHNILQLVFLLGFLSYVVLCMGDKCYNILEVRGGWVLIAFGLVLILHILYNIFKIPTVIKNNLKTKRIYNKIFGISDKKLITLTFTEIVEKIKYFHNDVMKKDYLDDLDIINFIMIKDNFIIAMINKDIINLTSPFTVLKPKKKYLTTVMEWGLFGIHGIPGLFNLTLFNDDNTVKHHIMMNRNTDKIINRLKSQCRITGIILLILSPFIFVYLIAHFLFTYVEQIKNKPAFLASREWNLIARYKFRDFNELPHLYQKRLNHSYEPAMKYISYFDSPITTILSEFLIFVLGAMFIVLLLGIFIYPLQYDNMVTDSTLLILLGGIIGFVRSMIPHKYKIYDYAGSMGEIIKHIHYFPKDWIERAHHQEVKDEFTELFSYKITNWLMEIVSIILTPLIFIFVLPKSADNIVKFMQRFTIHHPRIGYVCKFAQFNLRENGNLKYGSIYDVNIEDQSKYGKLEMSLINFKETYPEWHMKEEQKEFIERTDNKHTNVNMNINTANTNMQSRISELYPSTIRSNLRPNLGQTIDTLSGMLDRVNKQVENLEGDENV